MVAVRGSTDTIIPLGDTWCAHNFRLELTGGDEDGDGSCLLPFRLKTSQRVCSIDWGLCVILLLLSHVRYGFLGFFLSFHAFEDEFRIRFPLPSESGVRGASEVRAWGGVITRQYPVSKGFIIRSSSPPYVSSRHPSCPPAADFPKLNVVSVRRRVEIPDHMTRT